MATDLALHAIARSASQNYELLDTKKHLSLARQELLNAKQELRNAQERLRVDMDVSEVRAEIPMYIPRVADDFVFGAGVKQESGEDDPTFVERAVKECARNTKGEKRSPPSGLFPSVMRPELHHNGASTKLEDIEQFSQLLSEWRKPIATVLKELRLANESEMVYDAQRVIDMAFLLLRKEAATVEGQQIKVGMEDGFKQLKDSMREVTIGAGYVGNLVEDFRRLLANEKPVVKLVCNPPYRHATQEIVNMYTEMNAEPNLKLNVFLSTGQGKTRIMSDALNNWGPLHGAVVCVMPNEEQLIGMISEDLSFFLLGKICEWLKKKVDQNGNAMDLWRRNPPWEVLEQVGYGWLTTVYIRYNPGPNGFSNAQAEEVKMDTLLKREDSGIVIKPSQLKRDPRIDSIVTDATDTFGLAGWYATDEMNNWAPNLAFQNKWCSAKVGGVRADPTEKQMIKCCEWMQKLDTHYRNYALTFRKDKEIPSDPSKFRFATEFLTFMKKIHKAAIGEEWIATGTRACMCDAEWLDNLKTVPGRAPLADVYFWVDSGMNMIAPSMVAYYRFFLSNRHELINPRDKSPAARVYASNLRTAVDMCYHFEGQCGRLAIYNFSWQGALTVERETAKVHVKCFEVKNASAAEQLERQKKSVAIERVHGKVHVAIDAATLTPASLGEGKELWRVFVEGHTDAQFSLYERSIVSPFGFRDKKDRYKLPCVLLVSSNHSVLSESAGASVSSSFFSVYTPDEWQGLNVLYVVDEADVVVKSGVWNGSVQVKDELWNRTVNSKYSVETLMQDMNYGALLVTANLPVDNDDIGPYVKVSGVEDHIPNLSYTSIDSDMYPKSKLFAYDRGGKHELKGSGMTVLGAVSSSFDKVPHWPRRDVHATYYARMLTLTIDENIPLSTSRRFVYSEDVKNANIQAMRPLQTADKATLLAKLESALKTRERGKYPRFLNSSNGGGVSGAEHINFFPLGFSSYLSGRMWAMFLNKKYDTLQTVLRIIANNVPTYEVQMCVYLGCTDIIKCIGTDEDTQTAMASVITLDQRLRDPKDSRVLSTQMALSGFRSNNDAGEWSVCNLIPSSITKNSIQDLVFYVYQALQDVRSVIPSDEVPPSAFKDDPIFEAAKIVHKLVVATDKRAIVGTEDVGLFKRYLAIHVAKHKSDVNLYDYYEKDKVCKSKRATGPSVLILDVTTDQCIGFDCPGVEYVVFTHAPAKKYQQTLGRAYRACTDMEYVDGRYQHKRDVKCFVYAPEMRLYRGAACEQVKEKEFILHPIARLLQMQLIEHNNRAFDMLSRRNVGQYIEALKMKEISNMDVIYEKFYENMDDREGEARKIQTHVGVADHDPCFVKGGYGTPMLFEGADRLYQWYAGSFS